MEIRFLVFLAETPYSLGNTIDWKRVDQFTPKSKQKAPYSLGNTIDWKRSQFLPNWEVGFAPYSLGNTIDWKPLLQ